MDKVPSGIEPMLKDLEEHIMSAGLADMVASAETITSVRVSWSLHQVQPPLAQTELSKSRDFFNWISSVHTRRPLPHAQRSIAVSCSALRQI